MIIVTNFTMYIVVALSTVTMNIYVYVYSHNIVIIKLMFSLCFAGVRFNILEY
jgi:hypothetical protein